MLNPAAVVGSPEIQSTPIIPPRRDMPARSGRRDGGDPAGHYAPPWCAGKSGKSARTRRRRHPDPPRTRGGVPTTRTWPAQSDLLEAHHGTHTAPGHADCCQQGCITGPPCFAPCCARGCTAPGSSSMQGIVTCRG